jgi:hypothetical protein
VFELVSSLLRRDRLRGFFNTNILLRKALTFVIK